MKRLIFTFFGLFSAFSGFSQYGNEWVKFNQPYYKISVAKDGLYRLTTSDLQNAGFPVATTNPQQVQIFHRGIEQQIRVAGELDGIFNAGDYIEFYGEKNTGFSDRELYKPSTQPHQYYNLYSDTTAYFLTVSSTTPGLRMSFFSEVNFGLPAETSHTDEKLLLITNDYSTGARYLNFIQNTFFETGEGWTGSELTTGNSLTYTVTDISNTSQSSGNPILEVQVTGRQEASHNVEIWVGPSAPSRLFGQQSLYGSEVVTLSGELNWADIGPDGKLFVQVKSVGTGSRLSASYIRLQYPQTFNAAGATEKVFRLNPNPGNKSYLEILNAAPNTQLFDITEPNNVVAIDPKGTTTLKPVIDNTFSSRKIFATSVFSTPVIKRISFRNINPAGEYVIISNKALMKPAAPYTDPVKAYAAYRTSAEGGSYDTLTVEMDQLYNQFNYGEISPLAITRFMRYLVEQGNPKYLFLIGKGLDVWYGYHRNPSAFVLKDLVPTAGMPASDIYFTAGLVSSNVNEPAVATGRITASTPQEVAAYLNKVKEMEARPFDGLWRKDILHLSGGIKPGEPEIFASYLRQVEPYAEGYYLGGHVTAISKKDIGLELFNVSDYVNKGLNLVTLFGHSSPGQNDVNIGFVSAPDLGYNNPGKYPMFLINGCNAGDFFATTTRYGEDWINTPNKGAVGFMANTSFGYEYYLNRYSEAFYSIAYSDSVFIHKGIGDVQKELVRQTTENDGSLQMVVQAQQMLLLGDPAVSLFGANKPDYEINTANIFAESYTADPITAVSDSFALKIVVRNFGRAKEDTLDIRVKRLLSDNTVINYDSTFQPVLYSDTLTFNIPRDSKGAGNNTFTITLDPDNRAVESNENNNVTDFSLLVPLNAARGLYPQGFSIVNTLNTNLIVQSTNPLDEARDFVIELDTTDRFDSPFIQEFAVNGKIITQSVNLISTVDTLAYYWRVKLAQPAENESGDWAINSFTYIKNGPEGWAQIDFPQYGSNETIGLTKNQEGKRLELQETVTSISIKTLGVNYPGYVTNTALPRTYHPELSVKVNDSEYHPVSLITATPGLGCRKNSISLLAFNKTTALPYMPVDVQYPDARACGKRPEIITNYTTSDIIGGDGKDIIAYINNVAVGDSVILFSLGSPGYTSWPAAATTKLAELGISSGQLAALQPGEPVVIFSRKGSAPGTAVIKRTSGTPAESQSLTVNASVTGRHTSGEMKSVVIGPATAWQKISFKGNVSEVPVTDQFTFDVIGISLTGLKTPLFTNITTTALNIGALNPVQYPYLQLIFHAKDEINLTSPQLDKWIVEYTPAAEGVLTYTGAAVTQNLVEGETFTGTYGFMNISGKQFDDSLMVQYTLYNKALHSSDIRTKRILAPAPGEETTFDLSYATDNKAGLNDIRVYVNPRVLPELYYDNNVLVLPDFLNVQGDIFNPVVDVTIDGRYVVDGDYVSASPKIVVKVWDENPVRFKTDTTGVELFLKYPGDNDFTAVFFSRTDIQWFAATTVSDFRVEFNPLGLPEGTYTLKVNAEDANGNAGGPEPYVVTFVVLSDNSVVIEKPYPNPAQNDVFFTIVITGDQQPDVMILEILNANGQPVATFTKRGLFVGTNVLTWQRQNAAGNMVPNGMYLYRMILTRGTKEVKTASGKLIVR
ncbi:MAG: C25 family cysteine peptidase [Cyclobacteriaceae bacterium]